VIFLGHHKAQFSGHLLLDTCLKRVLSPSGEGLLQVAVFRHIEEVGADTLSVLIEEPFTGNHPDPSEDFDPQGTSCDCSNHIDCVFLAAYEISPCTQDVSTLLDINVVFNPTAMSLEGSIELTLHTVTLNNSRTKLIIQTGLFKLLFLKFSGPLSHKCLPCLFFDLKLSLKFNLNDLVVYLSPLSEGRCCVILHPVHKSFLEQTAFLVPIICSIDPSVEPTSYLHVSCSSDKISHHFFAQTLHLVDRMLLNILGNQNVIFDSLNRTLMFLLATLKLKDVVVVHVEGLSSHSLLPLGESVKLSVSLDTVIGTIEELLSKFEATDEHQPRIPYITSTNLTTLLLEPITFLLDKFFTFFSGALVSEFDEIIAGAMSVHCFCGQVDTTLQSIQSLGTTDPSVVASTEHLAIEHVTNAL
jgi:hypothetical protein